MQRSINRRIDKNRAPNRHSNGTTPVALQKEKVVVQKTFPSECGSRPEAMWLTMWLVDIPPQNQTALNINPSSLPLLKSIEYPVLRTHKTKWYTL